MEPLGQAGGGYTGCHTQVQGLRHPRCHRRSSRLKHLRLHSPQHQVGLLQLGAGFSRISGSLHAPMLRQLFAHRLHRLYDAYGRCRQALLYQATQNGAGHIAAANKSHANRGELRRCGHGCIKLRWQ